MERTISIMFLVVCLSISLIGCLTGGGVCRPDRKAWCAYWSDCMV